MIDVTLPDGFPIDLARICQSGAKVYFPKTREFGTVTKFMNNVEVKLDQGRASSSTSFNRDEFLNMLQNDEVVAKSRVSIPEGDSGSVRIKPRPKLVQAGPAATPVIPMQPQSMDPRTMPKLEVIQPAPPVIEATLTGYIDEKSGKFSKTMQPGMVEIKYTKVTRKMTLELDSVQLQKLRELGIIA